METNVILPAQILESLEFKHSFTVNKIGYYEKPQNPNMQRVDIDEAVLILCLDGRGYIEYDGRHYGVQSGDIAFLEPGHAHKYGSGPDGLWTIAWVHFTGDGALYFFNRLKRCGMENVFRLKNYQRVAEELNYIMCILKDFSDPLDIHKACALFQNTMLSLTESYMHKPDGSNRYIRNAVDYMKKNIYGSVTLQDISNHLGVSSYHIIRIFKQHLTITPMQYYYSLKLDEAVRLLLSTDLNVTEISQKLNYNNPFHFSQQFKKKVGVSPTAYKKLIYNKE